MNLSPRVKSALRLALCAALTVCLLVCPPLSANAAAEDMSNYDYYFKNFHVDVVVNDDRTYDVTETIDAYFNLESHGITRYIPTYSSLEREIRVEDFRVVGDPFSENGYNDWRIGDADVEITGDKRYVIKYTLWHYADEEPDFDYFYFNIIGTEWDAPILNASADIHLPDGSNVNKVTLTGGSYGSTDNVASYVQNGGDIHVDSLHSLDAYSGITIDVQLNEGAFANAEVWRPDAVFHSIDIRGEMDEYGVLEVTEKYNLTLNNSYYFYRQLKEYDDGDCVVKNVSLVAPNGSVVRYDGEQSFGFSLGDYAGKDVTFELRYTLAFGVKEGSKNFSLSRGLLNTDGDCRYEAFSAAFAFPFEISEAGVYSSAYFDDPLSGASCKVAGNTISINADESVQNGNDVELRLSTDSAAFKRTANVFDALAPLLSGGLLAALLALALTYKRRTLNPVPEYYPPDGMNPAEMGYVIDGDLSKKDVVSLIYYWASKKALKIKMMGKKDFELVKLSELPPESRPYERPMFSGLWACGSGDTATNSELDESYYEYVDKAHSSIKKYYGGERKLYDSASTALSWCGGCLAPIAAAICCVCAVVLRGFHIAGYITNIIAVLGLCLLLYLISSGWVANRHKKSGGVFRIVLMAVLAGLVFLIVGGTLSGGALGLAPCVVTALSFALIPIVAALLRRRTEFGSRELEKALGFKRFLQTAERERLEMLLAENPDYYYDILPYAQVLGVSDIWANKFNGLTMAQPSWSEGDFVDYMAFSTLYNSMGRSMTSTPVSSGDGGGGYSGGGGSFSGGGFSGGGSGGGGGGRW